MICSDKQFKPRSKRLMKQRLLCAEHARDLITSAERLLEGDSLKANIAFHLVLLALEEIGKAGLITSREVSAGKRDTGWIDKRLDDHAFKLLWGLWSTSFSATREINPTEFQRLKEIAERAHEQRLAGLYVDTDPAADGETAPKDAVSLKETQALLAVAKLNLENLVSEGSPDVEAPDDLCEWFWEVISDDEKRKRLFSGPFLVKYAEMKGEVRAWMTWARDEFENIRKQEQEFLAAELSRVVDEKSPPKERWRLSMRVYSVSHSVRASILNTWNKRVPLAKLVHLKPDEMRLELTLGDHIKADEMQASGQALSKLILVALNVGTAGFFWHEVPPKGAAYFEKIEDLSASGMKIQVAGGFDLQRHWRNDATNQLTALEEIYLEHAAKCAVMFMSMQEKEAEAIFQPYLTAMTMLGKSDAFLSLDPQSLQLFHAALENALKHFGDWDRNPANLIATLHKVFEEIMPNPEHRKVIFKHLVKAPQNSLEMQEWAVNAKRIFDLYLTRKANLHVSTSMAKIKEKLEQAKAPETRSDLQPVE